VAERKEKFALISRFEKKCKMDNISNTVINKYSEQWAADALLESFSTEELNSVMDYYFSINRQPTWRGFANNADRLLQSMRLQEEDRKFREQMREKAKEWLT